MLAPFAATRTAVRAAAERWVPTVILGSLVVVALIVFTLAAFGRAFGRWFLWSALFVNVSVEPVPPGRWTLWQFEGDNEAGDLDLDQSAPLAHSLPYQESRVVDAVADWLADRVAGRRMVN